jgi:hypothetical protein
MIRYTAGDYIIVGKTKGKRALLVANKKVDDLEGSGILESSRVTGDDTSVDFKNVDVVANLGPDPGACSVMGVKVEPYYRSFDHAMGTVDFYYRTDKKFKEHLERALDICYDKWRDLKLTKLCTFQFEVRKPKSPKSIHGFFHAYKGRDELDLMVIRADSEHQPLLTHLLHHEFAHAIWQHKFTDTQKANWIELYASSTETSLVTGKDSRRLYDSWISSEDDIDTWFQSQEEEDQTSYTNLVGHIFDTFRVRGIDIDILRAKARVATLENLWPESVVIGDQQTLTTEYAKRTSEENWAESFALHMTGVMLPKSVESLMKNTLDWIVK